MKKAMVTLIIIIFLAIIVTNIFTTQVYAENNSGIIEDINNSQGNLLQLKESQVKTLEEYKQRYGSDSYGFTAYILHIVQVYSIPFCFLAIIISIIYKVIIGARHLENAEKGLGMIVAVVTLTIICQVLPLVFALVVKLGRE